MRTGIIQPGRLGDLIILLPAIKYLADRGHKVYWPVMKNYVEMFNEVVDYVTFIPVTDNIHQCVFEAYEALSKYNITNIKDVAFTFPKSTATKEYVKRGDGLKESFDKIKYDMLDVPFEEKWNLKINRNHEKEEQLYKMLVKNEKYGVVNLNYSSGSISVNFDSEDGQIIYVTEDYSIFDWIKILENANTIALVESAMSNLVEQLNLTNRKILFIKPNEPRIPVLINEWKIV